MRRSTAVLLSCVRCSACSATRLDGVTVAKLEPGQATACRLRRAPPGRLLLLVRDVLALCLSVGGIPERGGAEYRHARGRGWASRSRYGRGQAGTRGVRAGAGGGTGDAPWQPGRRPLALFRHPVRITVAVAV